MEDHQAPLKFDENRKKYYKSDKGKEAVARYQETDKGKEARKKYQDTPKFKLALRKYYYSKKGQEAYRKRQDLAEIARNAEKWLKFNPGKTIDDYIEYLREEGGQDNEPEDRNRLETGGLE